MNPEQKMKTLMCALILAASLVSNSPAGPAAKTIDTEHLHAMIVDNAFRLEGGRREDFTIIDARSKDEYAEAHIFSAVSVPAGEFEKSRDLLPRDKGTLLVVYDNGEKLETSGKWAEKAAAAGYANVVIYSEGFPAWKKNKMPVAPIVSGHRSE